MKVLAEHLLRDERLKLPPNADSATIVINKEIVMQPDFSQRLSRYRTRLEEQGWSTDINCKPDLTVDLHLKRMSIHS